MGGGGDSVKTFQLLCDLGEVYILSSFSGFGKFFCFSTKVKKQSNYGDKGFCGSEGNLVPCSAIFLWVSDLVHQKRALL